MFTDRNQETIKKKDISSREWFLCLFGAISVSACSRKIWWYTGQFKRLCKHFNTISTLSEVHT